MPQAATPLREALAYVDPPPGADKNARCVLVQDASSPPFRPGSALLFGPWASNPAKFLDQLCVVRLEDGTLRVGVVAPGRDGATGLWTLEFRNIALKGVALIDGAYRHPSWLKSGAP